MKKKQSLVILKFLQTKSKSHSSRALACQIGCQSSEKAKTFLESLRAGVYIRNAKFALLRKIAKAKRIRFASLRRKLKSVRFAFASLFEGPNSPKSENFRRILAFFLTKTASKEAQN
ncbi:unnamed protein product [Oikopleura dioica]|uniref:Uncharacterized protein n=1 Tax=Oikopleura dioica TaxID=34765 RepID=E4WQT0_OIKDI|nr:unnamed protein product [Oikopleura dioica]